MLKTLRISNYLIIDKLEINFHPNFTVMTGETGAGKSIILEALNLILGKRTSVDVLFDKSKKSVVEADIIVSQTEKKELFEKNNIDFDKESIFRREINPNGKTRVFINDTPVNLQVLKDISEKLIHLHYQHQNLLLFNPDFQLSLLDQGVNMDRLLDSYSFKFRNYKRLEKNLFDKKKQLEKQLIELEFTKFQLEKIKLLDIKKGTQKSLEQKLSLARNSQKIKEVLKSSAQSLLYNSEKNIRNQLQIVFRSLEDISEKNDQVQLFLDRLNSLQIEVDDLAREIEGYENQLEFEEYDVEEITNKLNQIYELIQRFNLKNGDELLEIQYKLNQKINNITRLSEEVSNSEKKYQEQQRYLIQRAKEIEIQRKLFIPKLKKIVVQRLKDIGMPNTKIEVNLITLKELNEMGINRLEFLFSANTGQVPQDIKQVASGGELSRLMFVLKSIVVDSGKFETMVLDEIDTGISGYIADKMSEMMKSMSEKCQIITITHLPQVASKADRHLKVQKTQKTKQTNTTVLTLSVEERVKEIAGMLSGKQITKEALANAKQLLNLAE